MGEQFEEDFVKAKNDYDVFQQIGTNQHNLEFDISKNYENIRNNVCAKSFKFIESGQKAFVCPLCNSLSLKEFAGEICETCNICTIGQETLGIKIYDSTDY